MFHIVMIVVMVLTAIIGAIAFHLFELLATLSRASAVFSLALDRIAKFFLCTLNASLAALPPVVTVVRACWKRRSKQADNRQQCNTKNSDSTSHVFSLNRNLQPG